MSEQSELNPNTVPKATFTLDPGVYVRLDALTNELFEKDFATYTAQDPNDAYHLLQEFAQHELHNRDKASLGDKSVSRKLDGAQATEAFARYALQESGTIIDTDIQPVDVVVSIFKDTTFLDHIRGRVTPDIEKVSFHVDPPNSAQ